MSSLTEGRWIRVLYWGLKRPDEAQALLERAQGWWPDREWRRRLDAVRLELGALLEGFSGTLAGGDRGVAQQQLLLHTAAQLEHMPLQAAQLY